jgi:myo-inositol 2-dehydrogenase/D-chiro-inositol 1-dehydrogenase
MIRIGLVGCGHIGGVHAYAIDQLVRHGLVDAALAATFDSDAARSVRMAERYGAEPCPSLDTLVHAVDVVWICTWTAAHLEAVECAADAGRAVFCEKPLAPDLATCDRVARALDRVPHQVGLVLRYAPVFATAAEFVASGRFGAPLATTLRDDQYFPIQGFYRSTWRKDVSAAGGGTLIEHSIHDVDVLRWILGDPASITARAASRFGHAGIDDTVSATMAYPDGSVAQLTSVWHQVLSRESSRRLEIFCEDAWMWTDDDYLGPLHVQTSTGEDVVEAHRPGWSDAFEVPEQYRNGLAAYAMPTRTFLDALATHGAAAGGHPGAAEALAAHRIVDAAYRSAAAGGAPISLDRVDQHLPDEEGRVP